MREQQLVALQCLLLCPSAYGICSAAMQTNGGALYTTLIALVVCAAAQCGVLVEAVLFADAQCLAGSRAAGTANAL